MTGSRPGPTKRMVLVICAFAGSFGSALTMFPRFQISLTGLLLFCAAAQAAEVAPDFVREVRPILSNYCFKCHGPDDKARKAELRLDLREAAIGEAESGARAIVPGKIEESELVARIFSDDKEEVMPPPSMKKELSA